MLGKLLSPLTTATSIGVTLRYLTAVAGSILAILGILGVLTPEQIEALKAQIEILTANLPALLAAIGALITAWVTFYAAITKSSSDKAAEVAKQVDAKVAADSMVVVKTPGDQPDIVVHPPK
ncbi:hypothetical protein MAUB1S_11481 [Mycolicibacterium aubagnense]